MELDNHKLQRFQRHILVPEIGIQGQILLGRASVLVVGCGGLGSSILLYLAAAGIGRIGASDADILEMSNLQRQVLHRMDNLGEQKAQSACQNLVKLNPDINLDPIPCFLTEEETTKLSTDYDIIIDGSDNLETRYMLNKVAHISGKPVIFGAVREFFGQMTTVIPRKSPCYECLFPRPDNFIKEPPPGVVSTTPGVIGTLQATECIKIILNIPTLLTGRLLLYDGLTLTFRTITYSKNPTCPACSHFE